MPLRRAQPPRLSVLEPGRRRAARRLTPLVLTAAVVVAALVVAVVFTL